MKKNHILLVQAYTPSLYDKGLSDLRKYRQVLIEQYPSAEKWLPEELFTGTTTWQDRMSLTINKGSTNTAGEFLAGNLSTPSKVISEAINPDIIIRELTQATKKGFPFTHVGFSIFVDGYSKFIESARMVKKFDSKIITIAGNVGSLFDQTKNYVDYVHVGNGVPFLRQLLGEDINAPYQLKMIPVIATTRVFGMGFPSRVYQVVTKLGCPHRCDFCVSNILFHGEHTMEFFTPEQVHDALVKVRRKENKDFDVFLTEPTAIISKEWWYHLFDLFREETGDFPLYILSTADSLQKFDLDRTRNSALRIKMVNLGVESFSKKYGKNKNVDLKQLIARLRDYGISVDATFIVGFDHHTRENVWQEIRNLVDLDADINDVLNLRPLPQTPLWNQLITENRLLPLPEDFYYILYFQSFVHPAFRPGFLDILPLMAEIDAFIERERGFRGLHLLRTYQNIKNPSPSLIKQLRLYRWLSDLLYSSWKSHFNPSQEQQQRYLQRIGPHSKPPWTLRMLAKHPRLRFLASLAKQRDN